MIPGFSSAIHTGAFTDLEHISVLKLGDRVVGITGHWALDEDHKAHEERLALFFPRAEGVPMPDETAPWPGVGLGGGWASEPVRIETAQPIESGGDPWGTFRAFVNDLMDAWEDDDHKLSVGLRIVRWDVVEDFDPSWAGSKGYVATYAKPVGTPGSPPAPAGYWRGAGGTVSKAAAWVAAEGDNLSSVDKWRVQEVLYKTQFSEWAPPEGPGVVRFAGERELGAIKERL